MKLGLCSKNWIVATGVVTVICLVSVIGYNRGSRGGKTAEQRIGETSHIAAQPKSGDDSSPARSAAPDASRSLTDRTHNSLSIGSTATESQPRDASAKGPSSNSSQSSAQNSPPPSPGSKPVIAAPIKPNELAAFKPVIYPGGKPHYDGQPVAAFVRVASTGRDVKLSPNQMGEYPRVYLQPGETSKVLLEFPKTAPNTPVAVAAQDGEAIVDGKPSAAPVIDAAGHLVFDFTASENPGIHRVTFATPDGEAKLLDFWVGPELTIRKL